MMSAATSPDAVPPAGPARITGPLRTWAFVVLAALALILSLRLTMTETRREGLAQKQERLLAQSDPENHIALPEIGPGVTTGFVAIALLLSAAGTAIAAAGGLMTWRHLLRWLVIAAIAGCALNSALRAANRFSAAVGAADIVAILAAGWTVSLLCHPALTGPRGRRFLTALFVAILAAWVMQGCLQHFIDQPETVATFEKNRAQILHSQGIEPGSPEAIAYESRLHGGELEGFLTLSNVTAAALVGLLATAAGLAAACARAALRAQDPVPAIIGASVLALLFALGAWMLVLTQSNGGMGMLLTSTAAIAAGIAFHERFARHRRALIVAGFCAFFLGGAAIVAYGVRHDSLPGKSLRFRWYYWTAAATLIREHPLAGVGADNFGSYYTAVKRPAAPEDVSDPHSYFVRAAAELGIPAAALLAILLACSVIAAARAPLIMPEISGQGPPMLSVNVLVVAGLFCAAWWLLHYAIAGPYEVYFLYLAILYALVSACAGGGAFMLMELAPPRSASLALAALLGALGMFIYDQINMALLTGGAATLFWFLLGFAGAAAPGRGVASKLLRFIPPISLAGAAGFIGAALWIPTLDGTMPWDPAPAEYAYLRAAMGRDDRGALQPLDEALALAPRAADLVTQRILLKQRLGQPVADDIRRLFTLDRANARVRVRFALPPSDLPAAERARYLREALAFNAQLAPDEPKRLSAAEIAAINQALATLQPATTR